MEQQFLTVNKLIALNYQTKASGLQVGTWSVDDMKTLLVWVLNYVEKKISHN